MLKQDRNGCYQRIRSLHQIFCFKDLLQLILFRTSFTSLFRSVLSSRNENHHSLTLNARARSERFLIEGFDRCIAKFSMNGLVSKSETHKSVPVDGNFVLFFLMS